MGPGQTLLTSSRHFHLWAYRAGDSQLLLRSGFPYNDDVVELLFEGVKSITFDRLQFPDLEVRRAEDVTLQSGKQLLRLLKITLRTPGHVGHVVCDRLTFIHGTHPTGTKQWSVHAIGSSPHSRHR